jgi:hypothetical protein
MREDDGEKIVEVGRDSAGQNSQALQFLCLEHAFLEICSLPFGELSLSDLALELPLSLECLSCQA